MLIRRQPTIHASEITDEQDYINRRTFLGAAAGIGLAAAASAIPAPLAASVVRGRQGKDVLTPFEDVTTYNNFYEFGTDKEDPAENAHTLKTKPWSIAVEGFVKKPAVYQLEDFLKPHKLEERVYRLRCVEAWSMVIPWVGFPIADFIKRVEPTAKAKYV